jgi:AraC-like DNA-binding protein
MDPLTALLDAPRARDAFLLRVTMTPPWSVRVQDEAPLAVVAMTGGSTWYVPDDGDPIRLGAGDLLLIARPDPYLFADSVDRPPQAVIHPDGRCETPSGANLELPAFHGVRTWGNAPIGRDTMLVGTYPSVSEVGSRLLRALPPALLMRAGDHRSGLVEVLADEIHGEGIGQASLLDRLLDGLTVTAIRHWVDVGSRTPVRGAGVANSPGAEPPGWLHASTDPVVGAALDLMHDHTAEPWTVASLAQRVGMSSAGFARRFLASVGEPPMSYLTTWRLALAADRLRQDDEPVFRVASEVGYTSPFTFSTAFKRHYGVSPLAYRHAN